MREGYSGNARRDVQIRFQVTKRAQPTMQCYAPNGTIEKLNSPNGPNTITGYFEHIGFEQAILHGQPTSGNYFQGHFTAIAEL